MSCNQGALGSLLIKLNVRIAVYRRNSILYQWPILEVVGVSAITAATSYLVNLLLKECSATLIHRRLSFSGTRGLGSRLIIRDDGCNVIGCNLQSLYQIYSWIATLRDRITTGFASTFRQTICTQESVLISCKVRQRYGATYSC